MTKDNFVSGFKNGKTIIAQYDMLNGQISIMTVKQLRSRSPGLAVKGGDSYQKVVSSNPRAGYWMDIFHFNLF